MQNKANFQNSQMNVNLYNTTDYEFFLPLAGQKNKPNSNPIKPNQTQSPKSPNECKLNFNKGLQKKR
jgi:hypothetical protein